MPSTQAAPGHFQRIALFAECIFDLPLTRGKLIGASLGFSQSHALGRISRSTRAYWRSLRSSLPGA
ncbi:hypothetical protein ALQ84_101762 [Pseudomonas caricapapayae]|uniref:Uncharacterized protein n=1 Tax=Pseudomonas caricapapayae TaxID=46678 RepID=A0A3M3BS28_9PSED|nr:hypothetical protein ALQ84_101762 [Pseudomonas caricapapayae]